MKDILQMQSSYELQPSSLPSKSNPAYNTGQDAEKK